MIVRLARRDWLLRNRPRVRDETDFLSVTAIASEQPKGEAIHYNTAH
jgi:hypothetical protein